MAEPIQGEQILDLRSILGLLKRRFRLILLTVILVLAVTGGVLLTLTPVYTASTLVLVDPSRKNLLDPDSQTMGSSSDNARVESEVELARSETVLLATVNDLSLLSDPEFGVSLGLRDRLLAFFRIAEPQLPTGSEALQLVFEKLRKAVSVQRRGLTYLIAIQVRSSDPERAAAISNALAGAYIDQQLQAKIQSTLIGKEAIEARIQSANEAVADSERSLNTFLEANISRIAAETGRSDLEMLGRELLAANTARDEADAALAVADRSLAREDWASLATQLQSEALARLEADRAELLRRLEGAAAGSEAAIDLGAELERIETELGTVAGGQVNSLRNEVAAARQRASDIGSELRSAVFGTQLPAAVLTSLYELQQRAELARSQYQTLLARAKDLDTQAFLQIADSRIVSSALPPATPSFPNPRLLLMLAALGALGLGIGLAFVVENYIGGFTTLEQLGAVLRIHNVTAIPRQKGTRGGNEEISVPGLVTHSPLSAFSESVRRLRLSLDTAITRAGSGDERGNVLMISSAAPNEGKTTVALSLARAYALSGRTVLLIDCDLRKPGIHRQLGLEPSTGLLEYLSGGEAQSLDEIMTVDEDSGVQVVLGSRRSDFATDQLLASVQFKKLIAAASKAFDVVILDTPPIGPVVDGLYLAGFADAVAFIVRWAHTSQREASHAIAALEEALAPDTPIVAVLNQQDQVRSSYGGKYAGYYREA